MKLQDLLQELQETETHKNFKKQNPDSFFAAAFFILDLENKTEQIDTTKSTNSKEVQTRGTLVPGVIQLDFFLPTQNKVAAFEHPFIQPKIHDDEIKQMQPQSTQIKIDIDDLEQTSKKIIQNNESSIAPTKIIAVLRDNQWNLTCMDNHLGIIRIKLDAISGETLEFNKGSLMDFMGIKKP